MASRSESPRSSLSAASGEAAEVPAEDPRWQQMEERMEVILLTMQGRYDTLQETLHKLTTDLRAEVEGLRSTVE